MATQRGSSPTAQDAALGELLAGEGCRGLLIVGRGGSDPELAPFLRGRHVKECFVAVKRGERPRLGYWTPMEREEAAATPCEPLSPEQLDIVRAIRDEPLPDGVLATVLARGLQLAGLAPGRLALGGRAHGGTLVAACGRLSADGWSFVSAQELLLLWRKQKSAEEIEAARRAASGVALAFHRVAELLAGAADSTPGELWLEGEPLRVARLRREIGLVFARLGLEQPEGNIVAPGEEGVVPHNAGTPERILRAGETLVVDLYPRGELFADCTRTFCVGAVPPAVATAHLAVREALLAAQHRLAPGRRGWELQQEVCQRLGAAGFATPISHPGTLSGYVHNLGHGVGYELHEYPSFKNVSGPEGVLAEGDLVTVEPGLYEPGPGGWGIRLENLVYLGADGPENLTPLPYELDPRAWR